MAPSPLSVGVRLSQFILFGLIALGGPAWLCQRIDSLDNEELQVKAGFHPAQLRLDLQKRQPDWVLVSNSMLYTRLADSTLSARSGHITSQIKIPGCMSAMWFLVMKKIVAESKVKPKVVSLFFRCSDLTWADQRIDDQNQQMGITALDGRDQPEWQQVLGAGKGGAFSLRGEVSDRLKALFPAHSLAQNSRRSLQNKAQRLTRIGTRMNNSERRNELNDRLSLAHLRHDLLDDATPDAALDLDIDADDNRNYEEGGPQKFDPSPEASFLPHMVALAKKEGFKLHVHRVKQRPTSKDDRQDWPAMQQYIIDLRRYLDENGCLFTDESEDPALTLDMYADGDHISSKPEIQKRYLENFWHRMQPLIGGKP